MNPNSSEALSRRVEARTLTWRGPALMLFARAACAVGAQALVAAVFALRSSPTPWHDAEPWLPVYGTLIDAGCLALLWRLTRREGMRLFDLVGLERTRLIRDVLLGLALIPACLVFIPGGNYAAGWLVYGTGTPAYLFGPLPVPAALYGVLVFPFIWGLTEQMTYLRDPLVPATSAGDAVGDCARRDGWCERADRRASSAIEGMRRPSGHWLTE